VYLFERLDRQSRKQNEREKKWNSADRTPEETSCREFNRRQRPDAEERADSNGENSQSAFNQNGESERAGFRHHQSHS